MTAQPEITQRDLRSRSKEIMGAVQGGQSEFAAMSRTASDVSLEAFRADQDATAEQEADDPYAR